MSIASEIQNLDTNLTAAKNAVTAKGGTVGDTGLAGLATEIATIPSGGASDWGTVTFLDSNNTEQEVTIQDMSQLFLLANSNNTAQTEVNIGGKTFTIGSITHFSAGSLVIYIPQYFMRNAISLIDVTLDNNTEVISDYFCYGCSSLNFNFTLPSNLKTIGAAFLRECTSFNGSLSFPNGLESIGAYLLFKCSSFNKPISLPNSVTSLSAEFLRECTQFNSTVTLPNNITAIPNNFLLGCTSFNQPLSLPSGITSIGFDFLANCTSFNQPLSLPSGLTSIGQDFLRGCTSFNQTLSLPSGVTTIGTYFLQNCTSFNQNILLPQNANLVISISYFMNNCNAMVSTVDVGILTNQNLSPQTGNKYAFATTDNSAAMYTTGITLVGSGVSSWISVLPNSATSPYRKLILGS